MTVTAAPVAHHAHRLVAGGGGGAKVDRGDRGGEVDAGVVIHEGQLTYGNYGLAKMVDLGIWWQEETGLPLPLGGNVIRRALDPETIQPGDVVGIGIHTANALRGYKLGKLARERGAHVVFGGIHATLYARITRELDFQKLYEGRYAGEPFVDVLPPGSHPDTRSVRASNFCRIALHRPQDGDIVVVLTVIDNLVKGAAGQAVQNMNILFGLPEDTGLTQIPVSP